MEIDLTSLGAVAELLPDLGKYRLDVEDQFVQAGQELVTIGRKSFIALGELLSWKIQMEHAFDSTSATAILARYSAAWGVSRSNLTKAVVLVSKHPEVAKPADMPQTTAYEIVAGSDTPEAAEAGFSKAVEDGWGVDAVREAKMLMSKGLTENWERPHLHHKDGKVWARSADGTEVWVAEFNPDLDRLTQGGIALLRYRAHV